MIDWNQQVTAEDKATTLATRARDTANTEAQAYLASTDWYITRNVETGVEVPIDILEVRQAARDLIVKI